MMSSSLLPADMQNDDWQIRIETIQDRFYNEIVSSIDCGPFDGGCVVVANALQSVIGGSVVVLTRSNGRADHAAVELNGLLYDFDGPLPPNDFLDRFNSSELAEATGYRAIQDGDLPNAARDAGLTDRLSFLLNTALEGYSIKPCADTHIPTA